jgi:hypothetical protein
MVMRVQLQSQHLWGVIEHGADDDGDDRAVLVALLRVVPPELVHTLAGPNAEGASAVCLTLSRSQTSLTVGTGFVPNAWTMVTMLIF